MAIEKVEDNQAAQSSKFDMRCTIDFTYTDGGRWHTIEVDCREYLEIISNGVVDEKPICAIKVVTVTDDEVVAFIYDFVQRALGKNPWRMV